MKLIVTNNHGDPIYRLGIELPPHDKKEIDVKETSHLRILEACQFLTVDQKTERQKKANK